jgi:hypothetical protein
VDTVESSDDQALAHNLETTLGRPSISV